MYKRVSDEFCLVSVRIASVHAAAIVRHYGLPQDARADLEQEVFLELWRKRSRYDPGRASWRTFSERIARNHLVSLMRKVRSSAYGFDKEVPLDNIGCFASPFLEYIELPGDVRRVVAGLSAFDRVIAQSLMVYSAAATAKRLKMSRTAVYRAIGRLRIAFSAAGLTHSDSAYAARSWSKC